MTDTTQRPEKRVLLLELAERTSERGTLWLSGWLGKARLVGFKAKEPDKWGNAVWQVFAVEPREQPQPAAPRSSLTMPAPGRVEGYAVVVGTKDERRTQELRGSCSL